MRVLVTGGRGFLGSNFLRLGRVLGGDLWAFSGSILDPEQIERALTHVKPHAIVHFAAKVGGVSSFADPEGYARTNLEGTTKLLNYAVKTSVRRFIQISTIEVYGSVKDPTEESCLRPESPYAASKAAADLMALTYRALEVVIVRPPASYGPGDRPYKMIPLFAFKAKSGLEIDMYGDGLNVRDWLHVDDTCRGILLALEKGSSGQIYNLGSGDTRTNLDIARRILKVEKRPEHLIRFVPDRPGNGRLFAADWRKAEHHLGFSPKIGFERGFPEVVRCYTGREETVGGRK